MGVEKTSLETIELIHGIYDLMEKTKTDIKEKLPKIWWRYFLCILIQR
jgi:hypothetical protein